MSTHLPQARAGFDPDNASQIEVIEANFLRINGTYPEVEETIYDRWFRILAVLPEMHGTHLWDDVSTALQAIYRNEMSISRLGAAIDYAMLRYRFFEFLNMNKMGRAHVNDFHMEAAAIWRDKLIDRFLELEPAAVMGDEYVPPKLTNKVTHEWLN